VPFKLSVSIVLTTIILLACVVRFVGLEISPPGFFYDEATGAAHSLCYQQTGADLFAKRGIFSQVDFSGFQSAPFVIGGALWTSVFGIDVTGFRSFVAFAGVMSVLGVYVLARMLSPDRHYALWAAALAACLPWAFQFSRISWDAPLGVTFLVWGLALAYRRSVTDKASMPDLLIWGTAGVLLTLASYTYSPLRIQALLMVLLLPHIRWLPRATILLVFALGNIAVLQYYQDPAFAHRAQLLALTSDDPSNPFRDASIPGLLMAYFSQMASHFSLPFLLGPGDQNLRHSIQSHGVLDLVSFFGLLVGAVLALATLLDFRRVTPAQISIASIGLLGILAGVTPSALTWDSTPHALRAIGAWPFVAMLAAFGLTSILRAKESQLAASALLALLFGVYLQSYFVKYPPIAQWWFDAEFVEQIRSTDTFPDHYQPVVRAYYRMAQLGESCAAVRTSMGVTP
jgi:hypothetical protein